MPLDVPMLTIPWAEGTLCALCRTLREGSCVLKYTEKTLRISAARKCALCRFFFEDIVRQTLRAAAGPADIEISRDGFRVSVLDFNKTVHRFEIYTTNQGRTYKAKCHLVRG